MQFHHRAPALLNMPPAAPGVRLTWLPHPEIERVRWESPPRPADEIAIAPGVARLIENTAA
jgi:hypothetical protein